MAVGDIRRDHATTVGVLGVFILLCGIGDFITGIIWIARFHIPGGAGLWSGIPVSLFQFIPLLFYEYKSYISFSVLSKG